MTFKEENIPNQDNVYRHVPNFHIRKDRILPMTFKDREKDIQFGGGLSVDWDKYSTPLESIARHPEKNRGAILSLNVGEIRNIPRQDVFHKPSKENRAHACIVGNKEDKEVQLKLLRISKIPIDFRICG